MEARYQVTEAPVRDRVQAVYVVDFDMPFWNLVRLLIKLSFAAIPAAIVISIVYFCVVLLVGGALGAMFYHPRF